MEKKIYFFIGRNSLKALRLNWGPVSRNFFWTLEKLEVPLCSAPLKTHVSKNSDHEIPNSARNIWVFAFSRYKFIKKIFDKQYLFYLVLYKKSETHLLLLIHQTMFRKKNDSDSFTARKVNSIFIFTLSFRVKLRVKFKFFFKIRVIVEFYLSKSVFE